MEGNPAIMRGTGQGLLEFCERLAARGDIDPDRAKAYRTRPRKSLRWRPSIWTMSTCEAGCRRSVRPFHQAEQGELQGGSLKTIDLGSPVVACISVGSTTTEVGRRAVARHLRPQRTAPLAPLARPRAAAGQKLLLRT